jgi:hypothetical protein
MMRCALAIVLLALLPEGADAASCTLQAWSTAEDPGGFPIRARPDEAAVVVGRLPPPDPGAGENPPYRAVMTVTGSSGGWFRITAAEFPDYGYGDETPRVVFRGQGWVPGEILGFRPQTPTVHAAPDASAPVVDRPRDDPAEGLRIRRAISCTGEWFEVDALIVGLDRPDERPVRGFVRDICANEADICT